MTVRITIAAAILATILAVTTGCMHSPQSASPGCQHPIAIAYEKVEQFRDGMALEKAQWRSDHDTTELRLIHAHGHVKQTTQCVKNTTHCVKSRVFSKVHRAWWHIRPRWCR